MSAARNVTATFTKIPVINSITATSVVFGNASEIRIDVSDPYVCFVAVDFVNTPYQYSGRYIDRPIPILSSTSLSIGSHTASVMCTNNDGVASNGGSWTSTPFTVNSPGFGLTISKVGSGTVTSSDSLINCGADCFETYASGASVTLNAVASTGYTFTGWSGGGCSGTGACTTSMTTSKTITATFTANTYTLTYTTNTGGTITGTTPQTVSYGASGTAVTATPDASYTFTSWSDGVATATRTDTNVTANKSVTASFSTNTNLLTTAKAGTGSGTITSNPTGINCGADCTQQVLVL
ncbi:MAG: hypothetical protein UR55_C0012G0004 [Candidatus Nomurabacteria bacterium GW2011_GWF1_34_20]|nr:MAG: hypothetical protein UR55_C0012G0004 [Candidatus Nomurabacteria bacterium GW2011_GWF1_34_20]